jgi:hypothetical protein
MARTTEDKQILPEVARQAASTHDTITLGCFVESLTFKLDQ